MRDSQSLHLKVQEMCDCYATTDPLKEMSTIKDDVDRDEAALKWLALSVLHGINDNAKKIIITKSENGSVKVKAEYRRSELPSPGPQVGEKIIKALQDITHIEEDKGTMPLSMGIRESRIELEVKLKLENGKEEATLKFPE